MEIFFLTIVSVAILLNYLQLISRFSASTAEIFSSELTLQSVAALTSIVSRPEVMFSDSELELPEIPKGVVRLAHSRSFFAGSECSHLSANTFWRYPLPHVSLWYLAKKSLTFCHENPSSLSFL